ncbi:MAG: alanine--tRNA ligase-related protein, partial [Actinomycetota bacterium]|nr:alanine--tRNA ligase-related protein [Actinomycetota bacterium]
MEIRQEFLKYFEKNGHLIMPSSGLIPHGDPSVLLTTAGMQQFKPYYLGIKKPPAKRIATVQKCFRTSDIDSVGYTERHLTFFEMLGNFSFGDYFKKEAINYSLDFLLNNLGISLQNLYFTVFKGDKDIPADLESIKYWQEMGIGRDRIY